MNKLMKELEARLQKRKLPDFGPATRSWSGQGARRRPRARAGLRRRRDRVPQPRPQQPFTVRKVSHGEGVERVFQTHSPAIADIEVKRRGKVRRAKLYFLRDRSGKSARIEEKLGS